MVFVMETDLEFLVLFDSSVKYILQNAIISFENVDF